MSLASTASSPFRPPAPEAARRAARRRWRRSTRCGATRSRSGRTPISNSRSSSGARSWAMRAVVNDPAAVRRVFLDNAANYRKDALQLRVLRPGLGTGLLTAEGEDWRVQRRALAPLFSPRQVADFAPAMHRVARGGRRALRGRARRARQRRRRGYGARDAGGAGADAVLARAGARRRGVSTSGDALFRNVRAARSARSRSERRDSCRALAPARAGDAWLLPKGGRRHHRGAQDAHRFGSGARRTIF